MIQLEVIFICVFIVCVCFCLISDALLFLGDHFKNGILVDIVFRVHPLSFWIGIFALILAIIFGLIIVF
jgi:hypothetical protein